MIGLLRPTIVGFAALTIASGVFALHGCTVLTNDGPPLDAMVYDGPTEGGTPACAACVTNACAATMAVCLLDGTCQAIHTCASASGCGADCRTSCACSSSTSDASTDAGAIDPVGAYAAFAGCNDIRTCGACKTDCTVECASGSVVTTAGTCGGSTDAGSDATTTPDADVDAGDAGTTDASSADADAGVPENPSVERCTSCSAGKCGDPLKACALGSECAAFLSCARACTTQVCIEECGERHATGKVAATELAACTTAGCKDACGF